MILSHITQMKFIASIYEDMGATESDIDLTMRLLKNSLEKTEAHFQWCKEALGHAWSI